MSLLAGIGAVNAVFRGATGLLNELKRPKTTANTSFSPTLQQELQRAMAGSGGSAANAAGRMEQAARKFLDVRDVDGNGALSLEESGLDAKTFARYDADGNGALSLQEIQQQYTAAMNATETKSATKG